MVLLFASASVAIIHAILPDHWMPIAAVARADRWPHSRSARVALWTGIGHVLGSLALGVFAIGLGFGLTGFIRWEGPLIGIVLMATGLGMFLWSRRSRNHPHSHSHEDPDHTMHNHGHSNHNSTKIAWLIPVGIAASPDPAILPVFLASAALGTAVVIEVLALYAVVSITAIVVLTMGAVWGGYQVRWTWLEHHADNVTAIVLILLGLAAWMAF